MTDERGVLRRIAWRDVCAWLIMFRTFRLAKSLSILFLATLGAALTPVGWQIGEALFVPDELLQQDFEFARWVDSQHQWPSAPGGLVAPNEVGPLRSISDILAAARSPLESIYFRFVDPLARLFTANLTIIQAAYYLFGLLWILLVWGFFGGAITRIAVYRLGREEPLALTNALRHTSTRLGAYVGSPLFPLVGVALLAAPIAGLGLLARWDGGLLVAGLFWWLALFGGLLMAILLLGLLFGWPLMWGTIAAEQRGDVFEAFSRSYSYVFQRPLHYLFYGALATVYGGLAWLLVYHFSEGVIRLTEWSAAWGAGSARWNEIVRLRDDPALIGGLPMLAARSMEVATGVVRMIAAGFGYGLFWCLAAATYLLLRRDVDQCELDEIYADDEAHRYQLPAVDSQDKTPNEQATKHAAEHQTPEQGMSPGEGASSTPLDHPSPTGPGSSDSDRAEA